MKKILICLAAFPVLSTYAAQPSDSINGVLYRLFTPLTFYHSVAANQLTINQTDADAVDSEVDQ